MTPTALTCVITCASSNRNNSAAQSNTYDLKFSISHLNITEVVCIPFSHKSLNPVCTSHLQHIPICTNQIPNIPQSAVPCSCHAVCVGHSHWTALWHSQTPNRMNYNRQLLKVLPVPYQGPGELLRVKSGVCIYSLGSCFRKILKCLFHYRKRKVKVKVLLLQVTSRQSVSSKVYFCNVSC